MLTVKSNVDMGLKRCLILLLLQLLAVQESVSEEAQCLCIIPEYQPPSSISSGADAATVAPSFGGLTPLTGSCAALDDTYYEDCTGCECTNIDLGIAQLNQDNVTLRLVPGVHTLTTVYAIESVMGVSVIGMGLEKEDTVIECAYHVGLAFVNITNLTIENVAISKCGLRSENLAGIVDKAKKLVAFNETYSILTDVGRAVIIVHSTHTILRNVVIRDTKGVGLTAMNMLGESILSGVHFTNNSGITRREASSVTELRYNGTGGCAMFFYGDTVVSEAGVDNHLLIENCLFENSKSSSNVNSYVLVDSLFEINDFQQFHFSGAPDETVYPLDGAAGMSLIFSHQSDYHTSVTINSTIFRSLDHFDGGCMSVFFERISANTSVLLDETSFDNCRGGNIGGGLLIGYGYPNAFGDNIFSSIEQSVVVRNTNFTNCRANWGGGLAVMSIPTFFPASIFYRRLISLENCIWDRNLGDIGAAASFWEAKYHGIQKRFGIDITMTDCKFYNNTIESADTPQFTSAIVNLDAVSVVFNGSTHFADNKLSCIGATRSELIIYDHFLAEGTQVSFGGVLDFRDTSFFIVKNNSNVTFSHNTALWRGGAVSVNAFTPWPLYVYGGCFLHFERFRACPDGNCYDPHEEGPFNITFTENKARLLGHDIFGATFRFCPWIQTSLEGPQTLTLFETELSDILQFSTGVLRDQNTINFYMTYAELTSGAAYPPEVMPGQQWELDVTISDFFNQSVPSVNTLYLPEENGVNITRGFEVDDNVVSYVEAREKLRMVFNGVENEEIDFQFLAISRFQPVGNFSIKLSKCKTGFVYNSTLESCVCNPELENLHESFRCNVDGTIFRDARQWVGLLNKGFDTFLATRLCVFDYCKQGVTVLHNLSDGSEQCHLNRTGVLCGECKPNMSRVFGSAACRECQNFWLFYIAVYLLSGVIIVSGIFALQISVSSGYLNGPILYANLLSGYGNFLFPDTFFRYQHPIIIIFLFLNLDIISYETCFYDGMNELAINGIKLIYPFYLLFIVIAIVFTAKAFPRLFNLQSLHPVRAIATIMFISFTSLFQTIINILSIAVLEYKSNGTSNTNVRWLFDASVDYGRGWHGLLVVVSVLILVILLLPQVLVNLFHGPLGMLPLTQKLVQKWWPLFDAWHNPFQPKLRFWFGFQLFFRVICAGILGTRQISNSSFHAFFILLVTLITYTLLQAFARPYNGWTRNIIDLIFLFDLIILTTSSLYYQLAAALVIISPDEVTMIQNQHYGTTETCLVFAFVFTLLIFIGFILKRVGFLDYFIKKALPKFPQRVSTALMAVFLDAGYNPSDSATENMPSDLDNGEPSTISRNRRDIAHFSVRLTSHDEIHQSGEDPLVAGEEETAAEGEEGEAPMDFGAGEEDPSEIRYSRYRESVLEYLH